MFIKSNPNPDSPNPDSLEPLSVAFSTGEVVILNCGGPLMVVSFVRSQILSSCLWHNRDGDLQSADFPNSTLRLIPEETLKVMADKQMAQQFPQPSPAQSGPQLISQSISQPHSQPNHQTPTYQTPTPTVQDRNLRDYQEFLEFKRKLSNP